MKTVNSNLANPISKFPDVTIKRIMIVDASDDVNLTFKIVLSESDRRLRVQSFTDPVDALREFRPDFYDLVIIDILLRKMNGFELYDKLRIWIVKSKLFYDDRK